MRLRQWIKNVFSFSRAQTNGFIILLPIIAIVVFSEPISRWWKSNRPADFSAEQAKLDSLAAAWFSEEPNLIPQDDEVAILRFMFDPNRSTEEELVALGFSAGLTRRLINYRSKGGQFRVPTDLLKLYGMDSSFYFSLEPYVRLPKQDGKLETEMMPRVQREVVPKEIARFNLNLADTTLLKTVYGIGSRLSARIVYYRTSMGGFISADQLYEVYGLDSAVVERLKNVSFVHDDFEPRMINLNKATEEELAIHPYISRRMASAMVTYRFQHGKYQSVDDLRKILQIDENQLDKLRPYLTVDE